MDVDRRGETLWSEWDGAGFQQAHLDAVVFYTEGHVSLSEDVVFRALASAVQRDGIAETFGRAATVIQPFSAVQGFSGEVDGLEVHVCSPEGETYYGDIVDNIVPTTWVEVLQG